MKKLTQNRIIKRKKSINDKVLHLLSLQLVLFCIFINSYDYTMCLLPQALYFSLPTSLTLLATLLFSITFLIMSIGYSSIGFSLNNSAKFCNKKSGTVILKANEHRIQRSTVFFIHGFILLCVSALIILNIASVIQSKSF